MSELARRIAVTVGALLIFRLGTHIPLAGISPRIQADLLPSGAIARISIFSLSIIPYVSAAIMLQLVAVVWGLSGLERSGEVGRRKIARYTLVLTLLIAAFQAFGIASALQNISGLVTEPGVWFLLSATATMAGGVFCLVWLSEQITRHGIGNGLALILFVGVIVSLPGDVAATFELLRQGAISGSLVLLLAVLSVALVAVIVLIEGARRNVPVQYAARQVGTRLLPARSSSVLSIKLNSAGFLIPAMVTPWIFYLPLALATFLFGQTPWLATAYEHIQIARPVHMILGSIAVFVLVFIYTAYVLDPDRAAETLRQRGGAIPDVAPGKPTADYLDRVVTLTTIIGAVYLVAVLLLPEVLVAYGGLPYLFGGGSALIVVCTIIDIEKQVRGYSLTKPGGE
jgi:preprotein translocase subunit SecY